MSSFWATVTKVVSLEDEVHEVTDAHDNTHIINQSAFRHRSRQSVACGHITDDKVHDRHAMQHFTNHELKYLEDYMKQKFPADIPKGSIVCLHQHSDNAGQHFKNTGAINYYTTLTNDRGGPGETAFVYSFGAPGHGKGPYDGIGGRWKNKIDQCMSTAEREKLEFTESGYIHDVRDVYHALHYHFGESKKKDAQLAGRNPIHHYKFFCYTLDDNPILRPDETFSTLQGISKQYQFAVKKEGVVYMRRRSCFCLSCIDNLMDGTLTWGTTHYAKDCNAVHGAMNDTGTATETSEVDDLSTTLYCFEKGECIKTAGPGVSSSVQNQNKSRNEVASKLTVGAWVLFDTSDDDLEPIWLGRVMSNPKWDGQGVFQNKTSRIVSYSSGVKIGKGEVAIFVMWYEKINVMSDTHDYWVSRTETKPIVQNNKYFIPLVVDMHRMLGDNNIVPKLRNSSRNDNSRANENNIRRVEDWHDKEYGIVWKMDDNLRRSALALGKT